jgi:O-antigen/teichoic acid export membrane protein
VNLVLNLVLIPHFGIIGSSFSTVLTDMVGALSYYVMLRHEFGPGLNFARVIRLVAAAAIMGLLIEFIRDWNILVVAGIGALVYVAVVWVSGAFSREERQQLIGLASRLFSAVTHRLRPSPV